MHQLGKVLELDGEYATVQFQRTQACAHCGACMSFGDGKAVTRIKNTLHAHPGDYVRVELHSKSLLKASALAYGIPLLALLLGVVLGSFISDAAIACMGVGFALLAFLILRLLDRKFARMRELKPRMIMIDNLPEGTERG